MPLMDHFRPPLSRHRLWHAFHNAWATYLSADINRLLPAGFFASPNVQFNIEIDVATFDEEQSGSVGGWTPPAPTLTFPIGVLTDLVEIQVFADEGGPRLTGAIELVSPSNKDRPAQREAFVSKCASYIHSGVGLVIVDVVTERQTNLHALLLDRLGLASGGLRQALLYATAYRPKQEGDATAVEVWEEELAIGQDLPTMPLWLLDGPRLPIHLEETYQRTCQEQRVGLNGPAASGART